MKKWNEVGTGMKVAKGVAVALAAIGYLFAFVGILYGAMNALTKGSGRRGRWG